MAKILSLMGGLLLFFSWLAQQFLYDKWKSRLDKIAGARSAFQTYQSNNALFNAISQLTPVKDQPQLRNLQIGNYRFGLEEIRAAFSEERLRNLKKKIQKRVEHYQKQSGEFAEIQGELEVIQSELAAETKEIERAKVKAQRILWGLYVVGTVILLVGELIKK